MRFLKLDEVQRSNCVLLSSDFFGVRLIHLQTGSYHLTDLGFLLALECFSRSDALYYFLQTKKHAFFYRMVSRIS